VERPILPRRTRGASSSTGGFPFAATKVTLDTIWRPMPATDPDLHAALLRVMRLPFDEARHA
jgi:hypothetical protein